MKILGHVLLGVSLILLAAGGAQCELDISWSDATGAHTVHLANTVANPDYKPPSDPQFSPLEEEYIWSAVLDVSMSTFPIQFNVTGNWVGDWGEIWDQFRADAHITNLTPYTWSDFHVDIVGGDGEIYKKTGFPSGWGLVQEPFNTTFIASAPAYYKLPGQVLDEGLVYWSNVDWDTGDGTLTFSKRPSYVPEVGGLAVLLSGGTGLFGYWVRKRRG
jgi:hypothetical protein